MGKSGDRLLAHLKEFRLEGDEIVRVRTGKAVGRGKSSKGYRVVSVGPRTATFQVLYHRLKFALAYGWLPETVDHADGDRENNRLSNLRAATHTDQNRNRERMGGTRKSALPRGVILVPSGRYRARVTVSREAVHLGTFDTPEDASACVEASLRSLHWRFYKEHR